MNRVKVENVLFSMGIPASINGFTYIADAMDIIEEKGLDVPMVKGVYSDIADIHDSTPSKVERCIRHAFEVARKPKKRGNFDAVEHYIGFERNDNASALKQLFLKLKREEVSEIDFDSDRLVKISDLERIFKDMADRGTLLARGGVTQEDLLI